MHTVARARPRHVPAGNGWLINAPTNLGSIPILPLRSENYYHRIPLCKRLSAVEYDSGQTYVGRTMDKLWKRSPISARFDARRKVSSEAKGKLLRALG